MPKKPVDPTVQLAEQLADKKKVWKKKTNQLQSEVDAVAKEVEHTRHHRLHLEEQLQRLKQQKEALITVDTKDRKAWVSNAHHQQDIATQDEERLQQQQGLLRMIQTMKESQDRRWQWLQQQRDEFLQSKHVQDFFRQKAMEEALELKVMAARQERLRLESALMEANAARESADGATWSLGQLMELSESHWGLAILSSEGPLPDSNSNQTELVDFFMYEMLQQGIYRRCCSSRTPINIPFPTCLQESFFHSTEQTLAKEVDVARNQILHELKAIKMGKPGLGAVAAVARRMNVESELKGLEKPCPLRVVYLNCLLSQDRKKLRFPTVNLDPSTEAGLQVQHADIDLLSVFQDMRDADVLLVIDAWPSTPVGDSTSGSTGQELHCIVFNNRIQTFSFSPMSSEGEDQSTDDGTTLKTGRPHPCPTLALCHEAVMNSRSPATAQEGSDSKTLLCDLDGLFSSLAEEARAKRFHLKVQVGLPSLLAYIPRLSVAGFPKALRLSVSGIDIQSASMNFIGYLSTDLPSQLEDSAFGTAKILLCEDSHFRTANDQPGLLLTTRRGLEQYLKNQLQNPLPVTAWFGFWVARELRTRMKVPFVEVIILRVEGRSASLDLQQQQLPTLTLGGDRTRGEGALSAGFPILFTYLTLSDSPAEESKSDGQDDLKKFHPSVRRFIQEGTTASAFPSALVSLVGCSVPTIPELTTPLELVLPRPYRIRALRTNADTNGLALISRTQLMQHIPLFIQQEVQPRFRAERIPVEQFPEDVSLL